MLLRHCFAIAGPSEHRTPAIQRLEQRLGRDLTRRLVASLTGPGQRPGDVSRPE